MCARTNSGNPSMPSTLISCPLEGPSKTTTFGPHVGAKTELKILSREEQKAEARAQLGEGVEAESNNYSVYIKEAEWVEEG